MPRAEVHVDLYTDIMSGYVSHTPVRTYDPYTIPDFNPSDMPTLTVESSVSEDYDEYDGSDVCPHCGGNHAHDNIIAELIASLTQDELGYNLAA